MWQQFRLFVLAKPQPTNTYGYDNNGNITSVNENGSTTQYVYDALNRLSTITRPDGSELLYTYDAQGNRTAVEVDISNIIPGTFAYNDWEELESFTSDNNTYTYTYDAQGMRTGKTGPDGTTRYHCDNAGRVIAESDASNQVTAEIIWGHKPLAQKVGSSYYYYLYNGHGDVIALTNESGQIVNSYSYDEWGNIKNKQETISNPIRYGGEYYDEESGLYYLRARYYDPTIGRFISKDSVEGDITNPLSLNLYTYCNNNPINFVDPTGHQPGDENLPKGTLAILEAAGRAYNAAKAIGDTAGMAAAHNTAEIARSWAGHCSYNGVTMTPAQRDSIISSNSYSGSRSSSGNSSGGRVYSVSPVAPDTQRALDVVRNYNPSSGGSSSISENFSFDQVKAQPVSGSNGYLSVPVPIPYVKCLVGANINIDLSTLDVQPSVDMGAIAGNWLTWSPGRCLPGGSTNVSWYWGAGATAGIGDNASNSIGVGAGGGYYYTYTFNKLW